MLFTPEPRLHALLDYLVKLDESQSGLLHGFRGFYLFLCSSKSRQV